jgi:hypothetical protein
LVVRNPIFLVSFVSFVPFVVQDGRRALRERERRPEESA